MITDLSGLTKCRAPNVVPLTNTEASPAGAERLIVDAASELVDHRHSVSNKSSADAQLKFWRGALEQHLVCSCRSMCILHIMTKTAVSQRPPLVPSLLFRLATGFQEAFTVVCMPCVPMSALPWQLCGLLGVLTGQ